MFALTKKIRNAVLGSGAVAALAFAGAVTTAPARADSTSDILNAAATAAVLLSTNVNGPFYSSNSVVGYTRDGGTVLANGQVVYPNGDVLYMATNTGVPCSWMANGTWCGAAPVAYYPRFYRGHDHGHHYGWYRRHHDDDDD